RRIERHDASERSTARRRERQFESGGHRRAELGAGVSAVIDTDDRRLCALSGRELRKKEGEKEERHYGRELTPMRALRSRLIAALVTARFRRRPDRGIDSKVRRASPRSVH